MLASAEGVGANVGAGAGVVAGVEPANRNGVLAAADGVRHAEVREHAVLADVLDAVVVRLRPLPADLDLPRLGRRRDLNRQLDELLSQADRDLERFARFDTHQRRAFDLLTSNRARAAFDLSQETEATRRRYGNDLNGQSVLLARRLVEAGVPSVAVHWVGRRVGAGLSWDTHSDNFGQLKNVLLPAFDACYSALLEDLHDRGLLDETLVVVCTEMGRTPKVGDPRTGGNGPSGRDHWDHCMAALLAGGGARGGLIHGASDKIAAYPTGTPVLPEDLAQTVFRAMGIESRQLAHVEPDGRRINLLADGESLPVF
ncbi:MAG: DUF1501 domain-containing protein [Planctomycetota bacterium]|nr:DUF1501 domain-containing protein [Planctomycetota bacterium]